MRLLLFKVSFRVGWANVSPFFPTVHTDWLVAPAGDGFSFGNKSPDERAKAKVAYPSGTSKWFVRVGSDCLPVSGDRLAVRSYTEQTVAVERTSAVSPFHRGPVRRGSVNAANVDDKGNIHKGLDVPINHEKYTRDYLALSPGSPVWPEGFPRSVEL